MNADLHWRLSPLAMVEMYTSGGHSTRQALDRYLETQRDEEQRELQEWLYPRPADLPAARQPRWLGDASHDPR